MKTYQRLFLITAISCLAVTMLFMSFGEARNGENSSGKGRASTANTTTPQTQGRKGDPLRTPGSPQPTIDGRVYWSQAVSMVESPPLSSLRSTPLSPEEIEKRQRNREDREKNERNIERVKRAQDPNLTAAFTDPTLMAQLNSRTSFNAVTNPIQNFDGPDADLLPALFGGRFAPPDTNAAVGLNHVVITTNSMVQIFSKTGVAAGPAVRISALMTGIANAADDDGDPIVLYDSLADRWLITQFNLRFNASNQMHQHFAISKTGDPTGQYYVYDFLLNAGRFVDYPHLGVWPDGYYMTSNDFTPPGVAPFLGAGCYTFERNKMLVGDPTAKIIGFNLPATEGGMLPTNIQGFTPPPINTPNLFIEFDADEFGAATDLIRVFEFRPNYTTPASSTLTQLPDIPTAAFDARNPSGRADIQQPSPGEGLDSIADRLMHAMNFRVLPGGVQSYVLNFTVNVSGVNPTSSALYQAGVRWMELRRNAGTGAITINQQATYAPGSGSGTGRDLWMASVAQDGEGNIALAANASAPGPVPAALNPTAIYTGRLAGDPVNTLPQGEVDALSAVTKGVQTATSNRWGDYSSMFVDPSDDCTFWSAFEYVDSPTASFDWNTRIFSFKVNPTCVTPPKGTFSGTITNCNSGLPIQGAIVQTTDGLFRDTNAAGMYSITASPATYNVTASAPGGFSTVNGMVTVTNGGNTTFNACLVPSAIIGSAGATIVAESCTPPNGAIDPNEQVTVSLCVQNTGGADTTNLVGTLQATGGVTNPSAPQNYGVVVGGGAPVCRNFTFTANGTCGGMLTASLQLQDGATNLGTVTYNFTLGTLSVKLNENFDGVVAPALPAGWVATEAQDVGNNSNLWATDTTTPDTAPNSVFTNDPNNISDELLDTPTIAITTTSARLTFRNNYNLESTFDGGVIEISSPNINGGTFTDITNAAVGGSFVQNGYNATISVNFGSPIAGRMAFSGNSGGYITTIANLGPNVAGQNIKIRFRRATDNSVAATGWRVDTVTVTDGFVCSTSCAVATTCAENFDGVTAPALPSGWVATEAQDVGNNSNLWATVNTTSDTAPNSVFTNDPNNISDELLDSPPFAVISSTATVSFRRNNNLENGFDGMVLEIKIGGGAFQDILAAGGSFGAGGYNGTISVNFGSPIAGRMAWTGNSGGFVTTVVNLPAAANGQTVVLRFRRATDSSVSGTGAFIDTITTTGTNCGGGGGSSGAALPWTGQGSTGTVDEADLNRALLSNFVIALQPGLTGSVTSRYNILATRGITRFCPATSSSVKVRLRDSDGNGPIAQVLFTIHQTNIDTGGDTIIHTFNSNALGLVPNATFQSVNQTVPNLDFDFTNNLYWIEAVISRSNSGHFADLGSIQIAEIAGTPCP